MSECLFCKFVSGEFTPDIVYESDAVLAFNDINPQAPLHVLIIPKKHIATINAIEPEDEHIIGKLYSAAKSIANDKNFSEEGYRVVMNCNAAAGQTVFHIHLHLLAGREFSWPPG